jgi:LysM repeat protein
MSDRPPNQIARVFAVGGLITMFLLVIIVIATSGGGGSGSSSSSSDSGNGSVITSGTGQTDPRVQKALDTGIYVVQKGDTLTSISDATGIDVDTLTTLNPTTDPQALPEGTHLKLR